MPIAVPYFQVNSQLLVNQYIEVVNDKKIWLLHKNTLPKWKGIYHIGVSPRLFDSFHLDRIRNIYDQRNLLNTYKTGIQSKSPSFGDAKEF